MSNEPSDAAKSPETQQDELQNNEIQNGPGTNGDDPASAEAYRRRILIGSQRDPAAYLGRPRQAKAPVVGPEAKPPRRRHRDGGQRRAAGDAGSEKSATERQTQPDGPPPALAEAVQEASPVQPPSPPLPEQPAAAPPLVQTPVPAETTERIAAPNVREALSPDLQAELEEVLADGSMDELLGGGDAAATGGALEPDSKHTGRVMAVRREDVFVELGSREQGVASLRQFPAPPEPGDSVEVVVRGFNREDGFYELTIPGQAEDVADWSDLQEGMVVNAHVTGHNAGGLECEVNHIRGFIPAGQVSLYRVEGMEQFVGEQWPCLVTEANPSRRNLVLSRRAILEREREEARQRLFESLEPGHVVEGVVRKLLDFGAFVDLGDGVDGLLHISQLSWSRVEHPRDVLSEGQRIKVKIEKIDHETRKIGLAYRDLFESPWTDADKKYPENTVVRGKVTKLMEFGAFVELEPGIEGLVHISELSHKRVWRASDVVQEGQEVETLVLSVDTDAQRIGLSMKQLVQPESVKPDPAEAAAAEPEPEKPRKSRQPNQPLQGGLGRSSGGASFGLKW
ncbi:MAG: S1 RNA-binding domain-containing protein [Thermoguttaceae bacterium]|jgi:small subunit ribosomal protein S1|nr:S1 RNA-binding domain-containing protein [Thermoguttaceae bacterium]